jgi:hypothetical protein
MGQFDFSFGQIVWEGEKRKKAAGEMLAFFASASRVLGQQ